MKKRFRVCFVSVIVVLFLNTMYVYAATNGHTQQDAVNWALEKVSSGWGLPSNTPNYDGTSWLPYDCGEPQCVDLIVAYWDYLLGWHTSGNAADYANKTLPSGWTYTYTPLPGDIAIWNSDSIGHIAIVTQVYDGSFDYVDTNGNKYNQWTDDSGYRHNDPATSRNTSWAGYANVFIHPDFSTGNQTQGANIGDDFYAYIIVNKDWIHLTANNNNVELSMQNSNTDPKQIWHFIKKNDYNQYEIINEYDGKALDISSTELNSNVQTYQRNNTAGQLWVVQYEASGLLSIRPISDSNKAIDVENGDFTRGNNIQIYSVNGTQSQEFSIYNLTRNDYDYYVPKPAAPTITSAFSYGNVVNIKWTESPQVNIFDNDRRYEVYIYDSNDTLIHSANVGDKTEYSYFIPLQGTYYVRVVAASYAYNTSYVSSYQSSDTVSFTVGIEARASLTNEDNGNVYLLFDTHKNYNSAKEYCESLGGHLATITSKEEQDVIANLCKNGNDKLYWLGGTDEANEGTWSWITGEKWSYTNWNSGEPNNEGGAENNLVYFKSTNNWNDGTASSELSFICEIEKETISTSKKKEIKFNGNTYLLYEQSLPWTEAEKYCESVGGHLVTINSTAENDTIQSFISDGTKSRYWLGATNEKDNTWTWVTGEDLEYTNWNIGEPNNDFGIEKYAHIFVSEEKDGLWNDTSNYLHLVTYGFICEIEKGKPCTKTTVTKKSTYTMLDIVPENTDIGTQVIVAIYNGGRLADIQIEEYTGDDISLAIFANYDEIKVMLWDNLSSLKPLGNAEIIKN